MKRQHRVKHHKLADLQPVSRENEILLILRSFYEHYPVSRVIQKSYVLSLFWAWFSQIQLSPRVDIPVPRFLTYRDP